MKKESYLTKEIIKQLKNPIPKGMCAYSVCNNCNSVNLIDFETALMLLTLVPEKELKKNKETKGQWDKYYLETSFCPNCKNKSNQVFIKKTPKKTQK